MANREEMYNALPNDLKKVNSALVEMNKVICGSNFDPAQIWGATAADVISTYMAARQPQQSLKNTVHALLNGLPGSSQVTGAIQAALQGLQGVIVKIQSTAGDFVDEGAARIEALDKLVSPHSPSYNYDNPGTERFGLIPAIEGIFTANKESNAAQIMAPIRQVAEIANAGLGISTFVEFATGSVELLSRALSTT